ncbi:hypothetical protein HH310_26375 [Actinoplanes sp. TBRC 11911]|uniref:hypothetical protein n=1 Tax=Actinoplanes sp. TBRC 11911 TaxID=2729386 RepID=UPI00145C6F74|nr:hypothetical protein [Actinoplanes sp. TBRC 11911]NMO54700.1 hypothetical protein [Actinoplanes sp. TBRC 11911]
MPIRTRVAHVAVTAVIASLSFGALPANAGPANEPADQTCARVDALALRFRTAGFSDQAAENFAVLTRSSCAGDV